MDVSINDAFALVTEGDLFLFRGKQIEWFWFIPIPTASFFIAKFCRSDFTHVGMASWSGSVLECLEFKEFRGGRGCSFRNIHRRYRGRIDVYRVRTPVKNYGSDGMGTSITYDSRGATTFLRSITGNPYRLRNIVKIVRYYLFGYRFLMKKHAEISEEGYVCSTAIAHAIKCNFVDIVPGKPDPFITPSDIANSALTQYLFTIKEK